MNPPSDFTTPRRLICPISRHFLPVEQPEPVGCCTTGLKKGSRFPVIDHFFSSGFGVFCISPICLVPAGFSSPAILVAAGTAGLAAGMEAATWAVATFGAAVLTTVVGFAALGVAAGAATGVAGAVTTGLAATVCSLATGAGVFAGTAAGV